MDRPELTKDARYLKILVGGVLEQQIVKAARTLATQRQSPKIEPADIRAATVQVLREDFTQLTQVIEEEMINCPAQRKSAA